MRTSNCLTTCFDRLRALKQTLDPHDGLALSRSTGSEESEKESRQQEEGEEGHDSTHNDLLWSSFPAALPFHPPEADTTRCPPTSKVANDSYHEAASTDESTGALTVKPSAGGKENKRLSLVFLAVFVLAGLAEMRWRTLMFRAVLLRLHSPGKWRVALICLTDQHQMRGALLLPPTPASKRNDAKARRDATGLFAWSTVIAPQNAALRTSVTRERPSPHSHTSTHTSYTQPRGFG